MSQVQILKSQLKRYTPNYSTFLPQYKEEGDAIWYNPETDGIYIGEDSEQNPTWSINKWNLGEYREKQELLEKGVYNDIEGAALAGVNQNDYGKVQEFMSIADKVEKDGHAKNLDNYIRSAAILRREDFMQFKTVKAQAKIISTTVPTHAVLSTITQTPVSDFTTKIWTQGTPYDVVAEDLPELGIPDTGYMNFTSQEISLKRYGTNVAFTEEFLSQSFDVDIKGAMLKNMVGQIDLVKNKKAADVLNAANLDAKANWETQTVPGKSDNNPGTHIDAEIQKLFDTNRGSGRWTLASNQRTARAFENNTFINDINTFVYEPVKYSYGNKIAGEVKGFTGLRWLIDTFIAPQSFIAFDPEAIMFLNGPTRTVNYTSMYQDWRGTLTKVFFVCKAIDAGRILGGSGVTS
jgi:hypothetical protein